MAKKKDKEKESDIIETREVAVAAPVATPYTDAANNDPYKEAFAVNIPNSAEIKPEETGDLVETKDVKPAAGLGRISMANIDAPSEATIDMGKIDERRFAPVVTPMSDAEWYNKYLEDLGFGKEEVERQKKAAKWAVAAQMLADSIGALSNVYWTGKGADAMKFEPGAPKAAAATNKMYADIREAREKAWKAALDERKTQFDMEMAKKNLDLNVKKHEFDKKKHEDDQIIKLGNLEISREKLNNDKEYQTKILDLRMQELIQQGEKAKDALAMSMAELGLKREQLKLSKEELAARVDGSYYADTQGVPKKQQFSVGGKTVSFDNFSEAQMYQIYNALPEEVKEKVGKGKFTYDKYGNLIGDPNGTPEPKDILHAIHANTNDPNVARAIAQAAGDQAMIDAYGKVITDKANADAAAAERKRSLIAEANKVVGVVDDDALKAAIKSGDEAKIQAEMDRVKAKDKYQRKAKKAGNAEGTPSASSTEVVQSTGEKNIEGF